MFSLASGLPTYYNIIKFWYLHSVDALIGRLALGSSLVCRLVEHGVCEGTVSHGVLVHSCLFKIGHGISHPSLGS